MLESLSYSVSGALPDRSRYSVSYSASKWTPDPEDLQLDEAIASFAKLGFGQPMPFERSSQSQRYLDNGHYGDLSRHRPRPIEPETDYCESLNSSSSRRTAYQEPKHDTIEYVPSSRNTHIDNRQPDMRFRDRQRKNSRYQYPSTSTDPVYVPTAESRGGGTYSTYQHLRPSYSHTINHERSLIPHQAHHADYDDIEPSDSISQISSVPASYVDSRPRTSTKHDHHRQHTCVPKEGRRGRTRRREDVYGVPSTTTTTVLRNEQGMGTAAGYQTRVISPFD